MPMSPSEGDHYSGERTDKVIKSRERNPREFRALGPDGKDHLFKAMFDLITYEDGTTREFELPGKPEDLGLAPNVESGKSNEKKAA